MEEIVAATLSQQRYSMWLIAALAVLAFLLASVGIYRALAYSIRNRVTEISIRIALGARPAGILRLVIIEGMKPTLIGMLSGRSWGLCAGKVAIQANLWRQRDRSIEIPCSRLAPGGSGAACLCDSCLPRDANRACSGFAERITGINGVEERCPDTRAATRVRQPLYPCRLTRYPYM
jgi:hypothetical protein